MWNISCSLSIHKITVNNWHAHREKVYISELVLSDVCQK